MLIQTEILVVGGGSGGICAALQAARSGAKVVCIEETSWLGGMLSAAGVGAIDGNHNLPSGLWGEFRRRLYDYYGGPQALATGWVSHTQFEPHVAAKIFHTMAEAEKNLRVFYGYRLNEITRKNALVTGAVFCNDKNQMLEIEAKITIDSTEYGDALALAGCAYKLGRESHQETGEPEAPEIADDRIQDLTYVAILKDYGDKPARQIAAVADIPHEEFYGCCSDFSPGQGGIDASKMLQYGCLPNDKYMINWPNSGNDFPGNIVECDRDTRKEILQQAKNYTLAFVHFIQTNLGFKNLGLAEDEFPTADALPLIPYIRESRRLIGKVTLSTRDITDLYVSPHGALYQSGIAVGDYPLDHHHSKNKLPEPEIFPQISAFNVPFGCLVPQETDGFLVAEKCISVTHLVNGCTRLQPVIMQVGQAAGTAAAYCVKNGVQPRQIKVRELQQELLNAGCWLMPFKDVAVDDWNFLSIQRIGLCGLMKGQARNANWVNEFYFYPQAQITENEVKNILKIITRKGQLPSREKTSIDQNLTRGGFIQLISFFTDTYNANLAKPVFPDVDQMLQNTLAQLKDIDALHTWAEGPHFRPEEYVTRGIVAFVIDALFNPFITMPIENYKQECR